MAATVTLTDSVDSVDFMDGTNYKVMEGGLDTPMPARRNAVWGGRRDGSDLIEDEYENREVTIRLGIYASSSDNVDQRIQDVLKLVEQARRWAKRRKGSPVELQYKKDGATDTTYFDVLDGELTLPGTTHSVLLANFDIVGAELTLTCRPFARGESVACLASTTVTNHDDSDHDNYADIESGSILGDVRGPLRLWLHNDDGNTYESVRLAIQAAPSASMVSHVLEAETVSSSTTANANACDLDTCSASILMNIDSGSFAEKVVATYNVPQLLNEELAGWYRVAARAYVGSSDACNAGFRCKWDWSGGGWWSASTTADSGCTWEMVDLGMIKLPAFPVPDTWITEGVMDDPAQRRFDLYARLSDGSVNLQLDYFLFQPMQWGIALGGSTALSGSTGQVFDCYDRPYTAKTGSAVGLVQAAPCADWAWTPLYAEPGRDNRVTLSFDRDSACNVAADTIKVAGSIVPRYLIVR